MYMWRHARFVSVARSMTFNCILAFPFLDKLILGLAIDSGRSSLLSAR